MNDQQRTETAADNCEVLRARLAKYEDAEGRPLHIDVNKAARALCNRHADICGVDREDQWKTYSQDFIEDAATVLAALEAQPDPWKASGADWCRSIHSNPDAKAWADFFVAVFPGQADKHELMFGWFANAMMAMHDHLKAQPGVVVPDWLTSSRAFADRLYAAGWRDHADAQHAGVAGMYDELLARLNQPATGLNQAPATADSDVREVK